jgi:hypothetical protein
MIHFRYGPNASTSKASTGTGSAAAAAAPAREILESVFDLPAHLRPATITAEESEAIRYGGCKGYELKTKGKK